MLGFGYEEGLGLSASDDELPDISTFLQQMGEENIHNNHHKAPEPSEKKQAANKKRKRAAPKLHTFDNIRAAVTTLVHRLEKLEKENAALSKDNYTQFCTISNQSKRIIQLESLLSMYLSTDQNTSQPVQATVVKPPHKNKLRKCKNT